MVRKKNRQHFEMSAIIEQFIRDIKTDDFDRFSTSINKTSYWATPNEKPNNRKAVIEIRYSEYWMDNDCERKLPYYLPMFY